jgi:hypothetical protein
MVAYSHCHRVVFQQFHVLFFEYCHAGNQCRIRGRRCSSGVDFNVFPVGIGHWAASCRVDGRPLRQAQDIFGRERHFRVCFTFNRHRSRFLSGRRVTVCSRVGQCDDHGIGTGIDCIGLRDFPTRVCSRHSLIGLGISVVAGYAFIVFERRKDHPFISVTFLKENRYFTNSILAALINYATTFAIGYVLSLYLQNIRGMTPVAAGFILCFQQFTSHPFWERRAVACHKNRIRLFRSLELFGRLPFVSKGFRTT